MPRRKKRWTRLYKSSGWSHDQHGRAIRHSKYAYKKGKTEKTIEIVRRI